MTKRIIALSVIFACSWVAWAVLTLVVHVRTDEKGEVMSDAVGQLWGTEHTQVAPMVKAEWRTVTKTRVKRSEVGWEYLGKTDDQTESGGKPESDEVKVKMPCKVETEVVSKQIEVTKKGDGQKKSKGKRKKGKDKDKDKDEEECFEVIEKRHTCELSVIGTDATVGLDVEYRKKGLLWFSIYGVDFDSMYTVENPAPHPLDITVSFGFPSGSAIYDNMRVQTPGRKDLEVTTENGGMVGRFSIPAKSKQKVGFGYQSRGMDRWSYRFGSDVKIVKDFQLTMRTDFDEIDFPIGSISPDSKARREDAGWKLVWDKESLVSGLEIGMLMPHRINPGPLAASMSLHAPVSLFFFFFVIFILQVLRGIRIHPMNYFFIAASFFAFNLLFSYLVDHMNVYLAFGISSLVSVFLVVSYFKLVVSSRFALVEAGVSQLVYQILFSLAHFMEGYTGLTVTIGAIITLAIVMRLTARVDWEDVFKSKSSKKEARISPSPAPARS
ncbi:MAG: cell envelope integrity protein CreD [Proteobacteria bacterium]|nr:cell envelope integrity protein CreD [Pseudomonadota bacterium]